MTWEQMQKAALDKIFSRLNYGTEVSLTSPDVADYDVGADAKGCTR
nr:MAG TPA: hypothetical protein [Caudoviricetes sp.]